MRNHLAYVPKPDQLLSLTSILFCKRCYGQVSIAANLFDERISRQVNMGGQMHALMVLGAVNPLIKVFDDPVEFLDALWLPFRRDQSLIKEALDQHPNVKAIFAHLDVVCYPSKFQDASCARDLFIVYALSSLPSKFFYSNS
jgi:hypothetical protein